MFERRNFYACILILMFVIFLSENCEGANAPLQLTAEKILNSMTLEEKVGQLFIIRPDQLEINLSLEDIHNDSKVPGVKNLTALMLATLKKYPAGGFVFFGKNIKSPKQLKNFIQELKNASKVSPIMAIDEEGGQITRIAKKKSFNVPKYKTMEAIGKTGDPQKAYDAAKTIASYLKEYGFTLNFAPVADINTNPQNIIIGSRAFGSDPELVSKMVSAYLDGLHSQGILGNIKHFPGHGDTTNDTHSGYVAINKTWDELLQAELIPFCDNFKKTDAVMIAHITLQNITHDNLPATLSKEFITGKLKNELGYNGLIITDALNMKAIRENYSSAEAATLAFEAGCDILLMPYDYREAFDALLNAVKSGRISEERLNKSVLKILLF